MFPAIPVISRLFPTFCGVGVGLSKPIPTDSGSARPPHTARKDRSHKLCLVLPPVEEVNQSPGPSRLFPTFCGVALGWISCRTPQHPGVNPPRPAIDLGLSV